MPGIVLAHVSVTIAAGAGASHCAVLLGNTPRFVTSGRAALRSRRAAPAKRIRVPRFPDLGASGAPLVTVHRRNTPWT